MKRLIKKIVVLSMAVLLLFAAACSPAEGNTQPVATGNPWENGGKQPVEYTYEEFLALTPGQQMAFQNSFGSLEAFDEWLQNAQGMVTEELPWENGGKQPSEFTYAEFEALSPAQQIAFQKSFQGFPIHIFFCYHQFLSLLLPFINSWDMRILYT